MELEKNELEIATHQIEYLKEMVKKYKFCKLTGLMKDQDFDEKFHRLFEEQQFGGGDFTLVIADIDYLHNVNKKGWAEGNKLIISVSEQLKKLFHIYQIYRLGGDEFCIIVRNTYSSCEEIEKKMNTVKNVTYCADTSSKYNNPTEMFKNIDACLTKKKLARPDREERL